MNKSEILSTCWDKLYTAVLADALDSLGLHRQAMTPGLSPVSDGMRIVGYARVGIYMPIYHDDDEVDVYEHEIRLIDGLLEGEVPVLSCNGDLNIAPWGELVSTRAQYLGAAGCITDGCVRDVGRIRDLDFPVFSGGRNPVDTKYRGKLMWVDALAVVQDVRVESGDLIVADLDGVVVVPSQRIQEAVGLALEKVQTETLVRDKLKRGASLVDLFSEHKVL